MSTLDLLIQNTCLAIDRIAVEHPDYAGIAAEWKSDLVQYPSAKHARCIIESMIEVKNGTYEE